MFREKHYVYNQETLSYELERTTFKGGIVKIAVILVAGLACFILYAYIYRHVLELRTPKEVLYEYRNEALATSISILEQNMERQNKTLIDLQMRDNTVYRQIFGMDEIPFSVRNAGIGDRNLYTGLMGFDHSDLLISSKMKMDYLTRKAYVQSKSFDEVSLLARRSGDMAMCVPSISPVDFSHHVSVASPFGYRFHPIRRHVIFHEGMDISGPSGEPIYATGDGVVESSEIGFFGYGTCVVVNHGFGYKTRYAHLRRSLVIEGQKVTRGDQIGEMGSTGLSTGTHLHYEVIYMNRNVNPYNYINRDMSAEEYRRMVHPARN